MQLACRLYVDRPYELLCLSWRQFTKPLSMTTRDKDANKDEIIHVKFLLRYYIAVKKQLNMVTLLKLIRICNFVFQSMSRSHPLK
jgi:hypothetical protein